MKLGVILPSTLLFGGVKRFLELGNIFVEKGHSFTVYTPEGISPTWFNFKGNTKTFQSLKEDDIDVLFTTETRFLDQLNTSNAKRKIFYHVSKDKQIKKLAQIKGLEIMACSTNVYEHDKKHGVEDFKAFGGIQLANYTPKNNYHIPPERPFQILAYGRLGVSCKGTKYIVRACKILYMLGYNIKLILFDTPVNEKCKRRIAAFKPRMPYEFILNHPVEKNSELFHKGDIFVAAESIAGWSNTVAEAMACGIPVIATKAGTKDILYNKETGLICKRNVLSLALNIRKLIRNQQLREKIGKNGRKNIEKFDWSILAEKIEQHLIETNVPNS